MLQTLQAAIIIFDGDMLKFMEESVFDMAMHYYPTYWNIYMVRNLVRLEILTPQQFEEITNQPYELDITRP